MKRPLPRAYHWTQITLHWVVALLVAVQFATGGSIERTHHAVAHGHEAQPFDLLLHKIHNRTGLIILGLMLARLLLRIAIGAPAPSGVEGDWRTRAARATHVGFYVVLIAQASTGAIASYFFWPVSVLHVALSKLLLALIAAHVFAALWHCFVLRDGAMARMAPWRNAGTSAVSPSPSRRAL
jgi:cytochrome b561